MGTREKKLKHENKFRTEYTYLNVLLMTAFYRIFFSFNQFINCDGFDTIILRRFGRDALQ